MAEVSEDGEGVPLSDGGDQSSSAVDKLSTFMCCSTESADKDRPNSPADLFTCFKNKDEAGDAPPAEERRPWRMVHPPWIQGGNRMLTLSYVWSVLVRPYLQP